MPDWPYRVEMGLRRVLPGAIVKFRRQEILGIPLAFTDGRPPPRIPSGMEIRWATFPDRDSLLLAVQTGPSIVAQRQRLGGKALMLLQNGHLKGVCWFNQESYSDIDTGTVIPLSAETAWLFGAWISKDCRRRGFYRLLVESAARQLEPTGVRRILLAVDLSNRNSRDVHRRLGAVRLGELRGFQIFGIGGFGIRWNGNDGALD